MLHDGVDEREDDGPSDSLRLLAVFVLALVAIGVVAAGGRSRGPDPGTATEPSVVPSGPSGPSAPPWCDGVDAEACGRWDPPVDPG